MLKINIMSEKKNLQTYKTYDFTKVITGIKVSTVYIPGIEKILTNWVTQEDKIETIGETFKKFVEIQKIDEELGKLNLSQEELAERAKDGPKLDDFEMDVYCLWSLLQQMKFLAKEQGYEKETTTNATQEDIAELGKALASGTNINDKLADLTNKLKIVK
tara:strand:- start:1430 stop:1909 length:480 start_codon:yes stop_codon:yes gene_type:complete